MSNWPTTIDEWQDVVDAAHVLLLLDSARKYGLISGGPEGDLERCEEVIREGKRLHGLVPRADAVERLVRV